MPLTVELAPNVYRIPTMGSAINAFLLVEPNGDLALVDAGFKFAPPKLLRAIESLGRKPSDVKRIVMTHAHSDHAGGLARMHDESAARVLAHEHDAPFFGQGRVAPRDQRNFIARTLGLFLLTSFAPCPVDEEIVDGQLLDIAGGLRVVHTPGHTPGHISLMHEASGVLLVGDALFNNMGLNFSTKWACSDIPLSRETAGRLGELDFEVAAFMHGAEIRERAKERVKEFLARKLDR